MSDFSDNQIIFNIKKAKVVKVLTQYVNDCENENKMYRSIYKKFLHALKRSDSLNERWENGENFTIAHRTRLSLPTENGLHVRYGEILKDEHGVEIVQIFIKDECSCLPSCFGHKQTLIFTVSDVT